MKRFPPAFALPPSAGAVAESFALQQGRLILWAPVAFGCGIGLYFSLRFEPAALPVYGLFSGLLLLAAVLWPLRLRGAAGRAAWLFLCAVLAAASGFTAAKARTGFVAAPVLEKSLGPVDVEGTVVDVDWTEGGKGARFVLTDLRVERLPPEKTPLRVRLTLRKAEGLSFAAGDRVRALARLNPPSAPVAPRAFDFQRFAWFERIGAFGFVYRVPEVTARAAPSGWGGVMDRARQAAGARIRAAASGPQAAVTEALMTGERAGISEEDNEAMRNAGLFHMLSISGLHIGLVAGVVFFFFRLAMAAIPPLALRHPIKKYAAVLAFAAAFAYTEMSGNSVPAVRSLIMTGIVLLAVVVDRVAISLRLVAIAALAIMVAVPESMLGASFQMSFAAVAALVFFYEETKERWSALRRDSGIFRRGLLYLAGVCATTVVATAATAPFSLYHFQNLALYGVLANAAAMPVVTFIVMPMAVLAFALMPLGLEAAPIVLMNKGNEWVLAIARAVAALPHSTWTPEAWPAGALVLFALAGIFFMLWKGRGRFLAVLPLAAGVAAVLLHAPSDLIVSSSGKLVAVREDDGSLSFSTRRTDRFAAQIWARRNGQDESGIRRWKEGEGRRCDESGCRLILRGKKVAIMRTPDAQAEDCAWADAAVSAAPLDKRRCAAPLKIDIRDLYYRGAYEIWLGNGKIESVESVRGARPWVVSNRR